MYFLGIDPGYARLGFGLVQCENLHSNPRVVDYGVIETSSRLSEGQRLLELEKALDGMLSRQQVTLCAIEEVFFRKNLTTGVKLLQARGVILLTLARHNVEWAHMNPKQMKKMITGHGSAEKKQVQNMISRILSLKEIPQPDDAADGLSFALCAWLNYRASANKRQTRMV